MASWTNPDQWERLRSGADCAVCRSKSDAVAELETSWVLVGDNDPIRGYACLVFGRHAIELHDLSDSEGSAFMRDIRKLSAAIAAIVRPIKMNYEVHGNTAPHLHVHFFPRYVGDQFEAGPIDPRAASTARTESAAAACALSVPEPKTNNAPAVKSRARTGSSRLGTARGA